MILTAAAVLRNWRAILQFIYIIILIPTLKMLLAGIVFAILVGMGLVIVQVIFSVADISPWLLPLGLGVVLIGYAFVRELMNGESGKRGADVLKDRKETGDNV